MANDPNNSFKIREVQNANFGPKTAPPLLAYSLHKHIWVAAQNRPQPLPCMPFSLHRWKLSCHSTLNNIHRAKTSLNNTEKQRTTITIPVILFVRPVNLQTITNIIFRSNFGYGSEYVNPLAVLATRTTTATTV